jgi:hypothetical protein
MRNKGDHIRKSLLKGKEALERVKARRDSFLVFTEHNQKKFEETRGIW